jgi:uncharacterized membrane protein YbhN (UPF0104 family)
MGRKENVGSVSIGIGAFLVFLCAFLILITYFTDYLPNRAWIPSLPWLDNYVVSGIGIVIGFLLLGYGVHTRLLLHRYAQKVEKLAEERERQAEILRQKELELRRTEREARRKEAALRMTKGKLRAVHEVAREKTKQVYRLRGKLSGTKRRLRKIEKIAKTGKK